MNAAGRTFVYVHGRGGASGRQWLSYLNSGLAAHGFPEINPDIDLILEPEYLQTLKTPPPGAEPPLTWRRPSDREHLQAKNSYALQKDRLSRLQDQDPTSGPSYGDIPQPVADGLADETVTWLMSEDVDRYRRSSVARNAVWRAVLASFPTEGHVVILAHSMGSVVIVDLLKRLSKGLIVDGLITIGSPLWATRLGTHHGNLRSDFPYDRVRAWVNLYSGEDTVALRPVSGRFPDALDIRLNRLSSHAAEAYCAHTTVARCVAEIVFGDTGEPEASLDPDTANSTPSLPARKVDRAWHVPLLSFGYTAELTSACRNDSVKLKGRLIAARAILAERALADYASSAAPSTSSSGITAQDLRLHSTRLVAGQWEDRDLVPLVVYLHAAPALDPFDIDVPDSQRRLALTKLLASVRKSGSPTTEDEFADAITAGLKRGIETLGDSDNGGLSGILLMIGLGVLALTGVGLVAAIPAGLAGAAAITATLAAFGPGGMIGGMATLALLTGTGAAAFGVGVGSSGSTTDDGHRSIIFAGGQLATQDSKTLKAILTLLVATLDAQSTLGISPDFENTALLVATALDKVRHELSLYENLAPDRASTKEIAKRERLLNKAMKWLDGRLNIPELGQA